MNTILKPCPIGYAWICDKLNIEPVVELEEKFSAVFDYNLFRNSTALVPGYTKYYSQKIPETAYNNFGLLDHLMFAIDKENFSPYILTLGFSNLSAKEIHRLKGLINTAPSSVLLRKTAYLYEKLTGKELACDCSQELKEQKRAAVNILSNEKYYTIQKFFPEKYSAKYGVYDNTLGVLGVLSPIIRRTEILEHHSKRAYGKELSEAFLSVSNDSELAETISSRMFIRESQMSFKIEGDTRSASRIAKYNHMLKKYQRGLPGLNKKVIIEMQDNIVQPDEFSGDYREIQNFIGHSGRVDRFPTVDYISPKPEDIRSLMNGLFQMHRYLSEDESVDPIVAGAALHLAFTAIHPLSDGNGRISRTLLHDQIAKHNYVPTEGLIFPISDIIASHRREYEAALENVTGNIIGKCRYRFNEDGKLSVEGNSADMYRYLNVTPFAEYLYGAIEQTLDVTVKHIIKDSQFRNDAAKIINTVYPLKEKERKTFLQAITAEQGILSNKMQKRMRKTVPEDKLNKLMSKVGDLYQQYTQQKQGSDYTYNNDCMEL